MSLLGDKKEKDVLFMTIVFWAFALGAFWALATLAGLSLLLEAS